MKSATCKHIHRINQNPRGKRVRACRADRAQLGARFKVLLADAGLTVDEAAKVLHVTKRTVQYWISGRVSIPYAAYRLVRIIGRFELPHPAWEGWCFHSGKLWSPEGHGFLPHESSWWGLLVRQAHAWRELVQRQTQFDVLMLRAGRALPGAAGARQGDERDRAAHGPDGEAGRAAQPPGPNLLLEHFPTEKEKNSANGAKAGSGAIEPIAPNSTMRDREGDQ